MLFLKIVAQFSFDAYLVWLKCDQSPPFSPMHVHVTDHSYVVSVVHIVSKDAFLHRYDLLQDVDLFLLFVVVTLQHGLDFVHSSLLDDPIPPVLMEYVV